MKETAGQKPYPVHVLPGRARIAAPGLPNNSAYWADLTGRLARLPGVRQVRGNASSRRLLILYDPAYLSLSQLLAEIFRFTRESPAWPGNFRSSGNSGAGPTPASGPPVAVKGGAPSPVSGNRKKEVPEPEDLPLARQFFNVTAGGAVLAALGVKRFTRGVSPLAKSPALFNLAAAAAIVTGYPLLKSGLARFSGQKQITFDLLMGALSLATLLLRESVPGLLVVWLANLNSLLQALLLAGARRLLRDQAPAGIPEPERAACRAPAKNPPPIPAAERTKNAPLPPGVLYGSRMAAVAGGLAALSGLFSRRFDRPLAALLAASPAPAGLALARRAGALVTDPASLTSLTHADTLLLINGWGLKVNVRAGSFYTFFDNAPDAAAALLFTALRQNSHPLADLFAPGPAGKQEITVEMEAAAVPDIILESKEEAILLGRAEFLQTRGISVAPGVLKARRLATLGEIPLFLARGGRLAAVAGIICRPTAETALALQKLSLNGIKIMVAAAQPGFYRPLERETGLAVFPLQDAQSLLDGLRAAGETVVVAGGENDPELRVRADVAVCSVQNMPAGAPVTPGIFSPGRIWKNWNSFLPFP